MIQRERLPLFETLHEAHAGIAPLEEFGVEGGSIVRRVRRRTGSTSISAVSQIERATTSSDLSATFDGLWLRSGSQPTFPRCRESLAIADLFSGCGGLSLGAREACRALAIRPRFVFASDINETATSVYRSNFSPGTTVTDAIEKSLTGTIGDRITREERDLKARVGPVHLVLAGPPCQGHSDLNNHTRRIDEKNRLVLKVARFAETFEPRYLLIENVQGIRHDRSGALEAASRRLERLGYAITEGLLNADTVGVPQSRRRYFLFASQDGVQPLNELAPRFCTGVRTLRWAIHDLVANNRENPFDVASVATPVNLKRMAYLFKHGLHDLPDSQRPKCHANGDHTYHAVYGRLRWNEPAPTITTGFGCMGQGRFVHPSSRRTLTPHEAARLQFFPDFFQFGQLKRGEFQQLIGNAVPSKLAYAILLHQLA